MKTSYYQILAFEKGQLLSRELEERRRIYNAVELKLQQQVGIEWFGLDLQLDGLGCSIIEKIHW